MNGRRDGAARPDHALGARDASGGAGGLASRVRRTAVAVRALLVPLGALAVLSGDLADIATVALAGVVSLAPLAVERVTGRDLHPIAHLSLAVLPVVEAAGQTLDLYEGNPVPFDIAAHGLEMGSAVALVLVVVNGRSTRATHGLTAVSIGALTGLLLGVVWEIVELAVDPLLSGTLQHGLDDTATDIAAGVVGGGLAGLLVASYVRSAMRGAP